MAMSVTEPQVWAAGVLAFQEKPQGGTEYYHTVLLIEAVDKLNAATGAMQLLHQTCPPEAGWSNHQATVTSYAEPPDQSALRPLGAVYVEVWDERRRQDAKYGAAHDDELTAADWVERLDDKLVLADLERVTKDELHYRRRMIQVAALAIAAVESYDRGAKLSV